MTSPQTVLPNPPTAPARAAGALVVLGDFACPLSLLAFRRSAVLSGGGTAVEWRSVERAPWIPRRHDDGPERLESLRAAVSRARTLLLPGEDLPGEVRFVPRTRAAVAAHAEARTAGIGHRAARRIFDAFWLDGIDIGDPTVLRLMLRDELRGRETPSSVVRESGYAVDLTGGPLSTHAWRLVARWREEWQGAGRPELPVLRSGREIVSGPAAVRRLGRMLGSLAPVTALPPLEPARLRAGLPSPTWISGAGGRWLERSQLSAERGA